MKENLFMDAFSRRLSKLRLQKGVSAREMSLDLGLSHSSIYRNEGGYNFPTMMNFFYICEYLGVTPGEFFNYEDVDPRETKAITDGIRKLDSESREYILGLIAKLNSRTR